MTHRIRRAERTFARLAALTLCLTVATPLFAGQEPAWEAAGWGGGGYYWAAAFHPTKAGVIYMGGDVAGVYKTEDHGKNWRLINDGLVGYGVYSLAVAQADPETVFAATTKGLCKSTDGGAHWRYLPKTGPKDLHITAERNVSTGNIAVDPTDSDIVYAGSPAGKIYKSTDGGDTWALVYEISTAAKAADILRAEIGKVNGNYHGGIWTPLEAPSGMEAPKVKGLAFRMRAEGSLDPKTAQLQLSTKDGGKYRATTFATLLENRDWQDVMIRTEDFVVDPEFLKKDPGKAEALPEHPDWASVNRIDICLVGALPDQRRVMYFGSMAYMVEQEDGQSKSVVVKDFAKDKKVYTYGNVRLGSPKVGGVRCVAVSPKQPSTILAATAGRGAIISRDAGETWQPMDTPSKATSVAVAARNPDLFYGTFAGDGVWKSADGGKTWTNCFEDVDSTCSMTRVAVSPENADNVHAIGSKGWSGYLYTSNDGGDSWNIVRELTPDYNANPTTDTNHAPKVNLSNPRDLAISPVNPDELFLACNWRPCMSIDGGKTLVERDRRADITCAHDIRFSGDRVYVSAMDEGTLVSEDGGETWQQLWPKKYDPKISGHNWRLAVTNIDGVDRVISTCTPWDRNVPNRVIRSKDGGETFDVITAGLPDYRPKANAMWGEGLPRALAVDPKDASILYLGIDGDPSGGDQGGGVFKSEDGGLTWKPLPNQPGSRRMFYGLAVDPTDSRRLYWGACAKGGGLYRSDDGGETWKHVFDKESWVFNVMVTGDGTVYCPGKNLWRSTDHGETWQKLTDFTTDFTLIGLAADPRNPKRLWVSATTWGDGPLGGVWETTDGGKSWQEITGDLPYRKPLILRFNPKTNELWAGGVGLFKLKR